MNWGLRFLGLFFSGLVMTVPMESQAVVMFDQNVTPDVIFGAGNANGAWTTDRANNIEVGLRTKLRFDSTNQPQNVFNSNGDGTYSWGIGQPTGGGFGFAPGSSSTAVWNFEWSVNVDQSGLSGASLDQYQYVLDIDYDPSAGQNFQSFDPINQPYADHALGTHATGNGGGTVAANPVDYANLLMNNNVAQNSWNYEFFDSALFPFNANVAGQYDIRLTVLDRMGTPLAQSSITVTQAPEPATYLMLGTALLMVAYARRRRGLAA